MLEGTIGYPPGIILLFVGAVAAFLTLDLFLHRDDRPVSLGNALVWSAGWVILALCFAGYLWHAYGEDTAMLFLAGYALEKVLSVDNLMVFVAIFAAFGIPHGLRHRVLFYGVLGAIVFRLIFVTAGTWLYALGPWVELLFAAVIVWTAVKMLQQGGEAEITDYGEHWSVRGARRVFAVWPRLHGHRFFLRRSEVEALEAAAAPDSRQAGPGLPRAAFYATPLFLCLIAIEIGDIVFAFDSVPAVIAVTREPLLVYTSMIFAILGLRQLYFVLAALQRYLAHLAKAIVVLLFFVAFKLALAALNKMTGWPGWHVEPDFSLGIILGVLAIGVLASLIWKPEAAEDADPRSPAPPPAGVPDQEFRTGPGSAPRHRG